MPAARGAGEALWGEGGDVRRTDAVGRAQVPLPVPGPHQRRRPVPLALLQLRAVQFRPALAAPDDRVHNRAERVVRAQALDRADHPVLRAPRGADVVQRDRELRAELEERVQQPRAPVQHLAAAVFGRLRGVRDRDRVRAREERGGGAPGLGELDLLEDLRIELAAARVLMRGRVGVLAQAKLADEDERRGADAGVE